MIILTAEEISELNRLRKQHKLGKTKSYSMAGVRKYAHSKLKK